MDHSIYLKMREVEDRHWWFVARREIVRNVLSRLGLPDQARILDAGCGTGGNLAMLNGFGQVEAMEMDDKARQLANARQQAKVLPGRLPDDLPFPRHRFDLITLLDVLEHINDDQAALAALRGLLKPAGRLLLTVPAFQMLWGPHDDDHHHQRRYRATGLGNTARTAGFSVDYLSYFNFWLFPLVTLARLAQRWATSPGDDGLTIPMAPLNRMLGGLFASERFFIPAARLPFGVSLIAVLKAR